MQLRALRQFSKQIVTHASIRRYRMLCALLPAVWLLFQVLGAGTAVIYSRFLPHSTFPAQLLWLAFLIGFRLVQLAATVPLQYQLLACCTSLAGLQAKTPYFLRTAYCLQLLTGLLRTLLFLPVPLLGAWGYRCLQTAALHPASSTVWVFCALHCLSAMLLACGLAIRYSLALGAAPFWLLQHPELPVHRIPKLAVQSMQGHLRHLLPIGGLGLLQLPLLWRIPRILLECTLCYNIPIAEQQGEHPA